MRITATYRFKLGPIWKLLKVAILAGFITGFASVAEAKEVRYSEETETLIQKLLEKASTFFPDSLDLVEGNLRDPLNGDLGEALLEEFGCNGINSVLEFFKIQDTEDFYSTHLSFDPIYVQKALELGECAWPVFLAAAQSKYRILRRGIYHRVPRFKDGFIETLKLLEENGKFLDEPELFFMAASAWLMDKPSESELNRLAEIAFKLVQSQENGIPYEASVLLVLIRTRQLEGRAKSISENKIKDALETVFAKGSIPIRYLTPRDSFQRRILEESLRSSDIHTIELGVSAWASSGLSLSAPAIQDTLSRIETLSKDSLQVKIADFILSKNVQSPFKDKAVDLLSRHGRHAQLLVSLPQVLQNLLSMARGSEEGRAVIQHASQSKWNDLRMEAIALLDPKYPVERKYLKNALLSSDSDDAIAASRALARLNSISSEMISTILKSPFSITILEILLGWNPSLITSDPSVTAVIDSTPNLQTLHLWNAKGKLFMDGGYVRLPEEIFTEVLVALEKPNEVEPRTLHHAVSLISAGCVQMPVRLPEWLQSIMLHKNLDPRIQSLWHPAQRDRLMKALGQVTSISDSPYLKYPPKLSFWIQRILRAHGYPAPKFQEN